MSNFETSSIKRLPYGNPEFSDIREQNMIYVDKTRLIAEIALQKVPIFISRPRRFGKSLLINTLSSLFKDGLKYFHGLEIEKIWKDKTYQVVHLDFSGIADKNPLEFKRDLNETIIAAFRMNGIIKISDELGLRSPDRILNEIAINLSNNSTVFLIDEYDAPLTHHINKSDELDEIISILNNFYATVKQYTGKFRFIFITGVTRASHVSIFSAFNNLKDLSLKKEFNSLLGFTQENLIYYFNEYIENAANILGMNKSDIYRRMEQYYDGYQFSIDSEETLYNPWSIISFLDSPQAGFYNYWFESGGNTSLIFNYIKNSKFNLFNYNTEIYRTDKELSNQYKITNIPPDILLFQTGYFTLRKKSSTIARLDFPNTEVEDSILNLYLAANNLRPEIDCSLEIEELSENIDKKDITKIINTFNAILNDCVSLLGTVFNDERSVRDIIYAALPQNINCQKIKERQTVKGFSDLEIITRKTHMVIEFKRTKRGRNALASLQEAIDQLQSKNYGIGAFTDRVLYRVAMVLSTDKKAILHDFSKEVL